MSQAFDRPDFPQTPIIVRATGEARLEGGTPRGLASDPSEEAAVLNMGNGGDIIQLQHRDEAQPLDAQIYVWTWQERITSENDWTLLRRVQSEAVPVWYIPYTVEFESWTLRAGAQTKNLSRPTAESVSAGLFEASTYTSQAWLDDVVQTILPSGSPVAGEVRISGNEVEVPSVTGGETLTVAYYPAYPIRIASLPRSYQRYNQEDVQITAREVRLQVPS